MNIQTFWKEKVAEPFEELQEKGRQQWMSLAPRERLIVSLLGSVFVVLVGVLIIKEAFTFFSRHETQAQQDLQNISDIQKLSSELSTQKMELGRYDSLRRRRGEPFNLNQYIESQARQFNVVVEKVSPTKPRGEDAENEDWVELKLGKDTTLNSAIRFLRAVEEALGVRLADLQIKPQFQDVTKMEVTAVVVAKKEL